MKSKINSISSFFGFVIFLLTISSCEKVIKLDLNSENPKIIIEAPINIDSTKHTISVLQTVNFDSESSGVPVGEVSISLINKFNNQLLSSNQISLGKGLYTFETPKLDSSILYELVVKVGDKSYSSSSKCVTDSIPLNDIYVFKQDNKKSFGRYNYSIAPVRNEIANNVRNCYQYKAKRDGKVINKIMVDDDQNLEGVSATKKPIFDLSPFFTPDTTIENRPQFKINGIIKDSVELELTQVNIEYKVFRYFFNLVLNQGGRQSATPSNPDPLFTNGALGYFSVQKSYTKKKWINTK